MGENSKKLLVVQAAALGSDLLKKWGYYSWNGLSFNPIKSVYPALTCTAQASMRTGVSPGSHGMIGNGIFNRNLMRPMFWEQSSGLVSGTRIWEEFRSSGKSVGMLFWQQSLGESVDYLMSPAPVHKHHGGMIQDCYHKPHGLFQNLTSHVGKSFNLMNYWGPLASWKSSDWIASATAGFLARQDCPDLLFTYLPVLDYDLQRFGPESRQASTALSKLFYELDILLTAGKKKGYEILVFGDYAIEQVTMGAEFPNRKLYDSGLLKCRNIKGMLYPDIYGSDAFAVVDHEIAHVYVKNKSKIEEVKSVLYELPGIGRILDPDEQEEEGVRHVNGGELVIEAATGYWLAYPWWISKKQAPDYASHVDIHNKPGYDPCELFFGWPPPSVSQNTGRIKGSHGKTGPGREAAFASTIEFNAQPKSLIELSQELKRWLV